MTAVDEISGISVELPGEATLEVTQVRTWQAGRSLSARTSLQTRAAPLDSVCSSIRPGWYYQPIPSKAASKASLRPLGELWSRGPRSSNSR